MNMLQISKTQINVPFVCRQSVPVIPNFTPVISSLSQYSSNSGAYTIVTVYGNNFSLYGTTGTSVIDFGNLKNIPVSFYSSQEITFSVPTNALPGNYSVIVVNTQYPIYLVSNSVNYKIL